MEPAWLVGETEQQLRVGRMQSAVVVMDEGMESTAAVGPDLYERLMCS